MPAPTNKSDNFLGLLGAPARRALENNQISTEEKLSKYTEKEILRLHGIGKSSLPILQQALKDAGLSFQKDK
jgi:DNA-directed RNA polymerase alpha subunit